ncbi:exopolysaccharide biosynthesis protein [Desulfitispora alkaliphila]|uniref:phosphodiester glycosidase family protein n=1 Tax=Desulfitispora alkaliphila TaxID=622674 RepID=UPI003D2067AC
MRAIRTFLIILLAPFAGILLSLHNSDDLGGFFNPEDLILNLSPVAAMVSQVEASGQDIKDGSGLIQLSIKEQERQYKEQQRLIQQLIKSSQEQKQLSSEIYERRLLERLGEPIDSFASERVEILLFEVRENNYRGYMAKVKLHDPTALEVTLGQGQYGKAETTSNAVSRTEGIFGVNGGGFYSFVQRGSQMYLPIGTTVIDGSPVGDGFSPSRDNLFFSGFSNGELVGGVLNQKSELEQLSPQWGVSFVPVLMQDRMPQEIPSKWRNARHPRTVVGNFGNGDLMFMVIDGRQPGWSSGATLEELQIQMLRLGVIDAYNLDGGGSSSMVFNGNLLNRPSDGHQRPVVTNIVILP